MKIYKKMKTSLVITLKNEESTILELLGSIVMQSKKPDELVIVDGGSVDKTVDIIKNYMHNKKIPTRILIKKNTNIARGRNIGIINANSKIISILDSDAYAHNTWIEKIIERFEKDKSIFLIGGKFNPAYKNNFSKAVSISDETIRDFFAPDKVSGCNMAIRKSKRRTFLFDERFKHAQDVEFVSRVGKKHKCIYDSEIEVDHESRSYPKQYVKQMYKYGLWKVYFMFITKNSRYIDFIPTAIIIFSTIFSVWYPFLLIALPLFSFMEALFILLYRKLNIKLFPHLFLAWLLKNFAWGLGTLVGLINIVLNTSDYKTLSK
jgi:glycosyltransferase involved in cell wall biosynthesis